MMTNLDTLPTTSVDYELREPSEDVQHLTAYTFNNLNQSNLRRQWEVLKNEIQEEYYPWLARYMIMKRVSMEMSSHTLYSDFLDIIDISEIYNLVMNETYRNIRTLLRSKETIGNFSNRTILRSLGHWLGLITLAKNKPISVAEIDLKSLILEAYYKGADHLLYIVPFISKIIVSIERSITFKPPHPWIMGLMSVLRELHQKTGFKLTLRFEIEILCKTLQLNLEDLIPTYYLSDQNNIMLIKNQLSETQPITQEANERVFTLPHIVTSVPAPQLQRYLPLPPSSFPRPSAPPLDNLEEITLALANTELTAPPPPLDCMDEITLALAKTEISTPPPPLYCLDEATLALANTEQFGEPSTHRQPEQTHNYFDTNINTTNSLIHDVIINLNTLLFQSYPHLEQCVKPAIEHSIQEWIKTIINMAIISVVKTCEQLILKDFTLDADEDHVRSYVHHIVQSFCATRAMVECRSRIFATMSANLIGAFISALPPSTHQQIDFIDEAASIVAEDNIELATVFIQNSAAETAIIEIDKLLCHTYETRRMAQFNNNLRDLFNQSTYTSQMNSRLGTLSNSHVAFNNESASNTPRFPPMTLSRPFVLYDVTNNDYPLIEYNMEANRWKLYITEELSQLATACDAFLKDSVVYPTLIDQTIITQALMDLLVMACNNQHLDRGNWCLLNKAVEGVIEGFPEQGACSVDVESMMIRYREIHIKTLKLFVHARVCGYSWTRREVTTFLSTCAVDLRYNVEAVNCFIKHFLVNISKYDVWLAGMVVESYDAAVFATKLVRYYLIENRLNFYINIFDLWHTVEALEFLIMRFPRSTPQDVGPVLESLQRMNRGPIAHLRERLRMLPVQHLYSRINQYELELGPPGIYEMTLEILSDWRDVQMARIDELQDKANFREYMRAMNLNSIMRVDDLTLRFLKIAIRTCVDNVYQLVRIEHLLGQMHPPPRELYYQMCDALVKLVVLLLKNSVETESPTQKLTFLNKVLGTIAGVMFEDQKNPAMFHQYPYHRLFIMLFLETTIPDPLFEPMRYEIAIAFCHTLKITKPAAIPGFSYAWIEILNHRSFVHRVLSASQHQNGWAMFATLIVDVLGYIRPFLNNLPLFPIIQLVYNGMLKLFLILLNDFPEFLSMHYYIFSIYIPTQYNQLRSLVLAAYPRNVLMASPMCPLSQMETLPEISLLPYSAINCADLIPYSLRMKLNSYLITRSPASFLAELTAQMQISADPVIHYNEVLINAVVFYVGNQAVEFLRAVGNAPTMANVPYIAHMDIFESMVVNFNFQGRYMLFNALANHLRYPNVHTHYFSSCILYLFAECNSYMVKEQILRMFIERLSVQNAYSWGMLVTFQQLIREPSFHVWSLAFVRNNTHLKKYSYTECPSVVVYIGQHDRSYYREGICCDLSIVAAGFGLHYAYHQAYCKHYDHRPKAPNSTRTARPKKNARNSGPNNAPITCHDDDPTAGPSYAPTAGGPGKKKRRWSKLFTN